MTHSVLDQTKSRNANQHKNSTIITIHVTTMISIRWLDDLPAPPCRYSRIPHEDAEARL